MSRRIFVTGGSGFVGGAVIDELIARSFDVSALVRDKPPAQQDRIHVVKGDLFDTDSLASSITGCDAVIHLVGIIMEHPKKGITFERIHVEGTKSVVDATVKAGVKRYIHMSALGTGPDTESEYHRTKHLAEQHVQASSLDWTIIRPSLIHGGNGEFMQTAAKWARGKAAPFLFMPYFGSGLFGFGGAGMLQPVYVKDVARAFVDAIDNARTIRETYPLAGPDQITWPQLHHAVAQAVVGKKRAVAPIPAWYAKLLTKVVPAPLLPFNEDQVIMSQQDNTCDLTKFKSDFGFTPGSFHTSLQSYAASL